MRTACVSLGALPLQLLLRREPTWAAFPVAVVTTDRPHGRLLWVNDRARELRVLPGLSYAAARTLCPSLRAAAIADDDITIADGEVFRLLSGFSPRIEPGRSSGVFWLDPTGIASLFGSAETWAEGIRRGLFARGLEASVVVGFHRHRTLALARSSSGVRVVQSANLEAQLAARTPLGRLDVSAKLRDGLAVLGIHTVGSFLTLPPGELGSRFGSEAVQLHRDFSDTTWDPLLARPLVDPIVATIDFEPPELDRERVLFSLKPRLHELFERLAQLGRAMSAIHLELELERRAPHHERLEPAAATLDLLQVLDLVRLRLDGLQLVAPITSIRIQLEGQTAATEQLALFKTRSRRDLSAAERALARLRAAWGETCVAHAELHAAHLPEAGFSWRPLERLRFPRTEPASSGSNTLVRRLFPRPIALPDPPRHEPEAWLDRALGVGAVLRTWGPFRISGGWWAKEVERDYYWVETRRGDLLWVFWDRPRRRWYWHGVVD